MITKKKEAVEQLQLYRDLFDKILNKECTIKFDMHEAEGFIVTDIVQKTVGDVKNKPAKVEHEGKKRSPMLFEIVNNQAPMIFSFDDTIVAPLSNGVRLTVKLDEALNGRNVVEVDIRLA